MLTPAQNNENVQILVPSAFPCSGDQFADFDVLGSDA